MSISRENWSALSTLAQQWTMEDKEEVERERRRKTKSFMSDVDTDNIFSDDTEPQNTGESSASEDSDSAGGGLEKLQLDFVEMLRVRDERRRKRHVETLSRQRQEEKGEGEVKGEEDCAGGARVEVLGDTENNNMKMNLQRSMEALVSSPPTSSVDLTYRPGSEKGEQKRENGGTTLTPTESSHTFVSSVSISFDKSVANTRVTSPKTAPSQDYQNESARSFEPTDKPAFTQQSSRTMSFRILKKKEEESMPLQRSASLRITAKKFESNQRSNNEEEQQSPFSRSSRQRLSSRTIQEKMERLAQASQKWEAVKSPAMAHKTLFLVDEVSRKRELFERDQKTANTSSAPNKQDYHTLSAGISSQVNRWIQKKTLQSLSSLTPTDLRHVDISSKKMLFEGGQADSHSVALK
ncbi:ladinin-1 isoform X1 [Salminus brasiliensis]|uniref:ladinin-1 isoform X1 n=1 Tax=Salminus brasiliensis TaxID=930266 RepID=UPI003B83A4BA